MPVRAELALQTLTFHGERRIVSGQGARKRPGERAPQRGQCFKESDGGGHILGVKEN